MRRRILYFIAAFAISASGIFAQHTYIYNVKFENQTVVKESNQVSVRMNILLDDVKMGTNDMLTLTPVIKSNTGTQSLELLPAVITGNTRRKAMERKQVLNKKTASPDVSQVVANRKNKTSQSVSYNTSVPFEEWMRDASLLVNGKVTACADCQKDEQNGMLISQRIIPAKYVPTYKLTYIVPEAEAVKQRSEESSAYFNFKVGRAELLTSFGQNASELRKVDNFVKEVLNDKNLSFTYIKINGFASPEGTFASNQSLSERRAKAFAAYLASTYSFTPQQLKDVQGRGEDWAGLRRAVEASTMAEKSEILRIIDQTSNPDARDAQLKKLSGGATYQTLLTDYYPPLRRTDYTVGYVARAFDVDEAKQIIRTKPQQLSLNEMYLVAHTYPADSKEFKEVFDIAARLYPDAPVAILNSAAADIEGGNNRAAIDRLHKIEADHRAWNNLGVAYARLGELDKAGEYFTKANAKKDADAKHNAQELQRVLNEGK